MVEKDTKQRGQVILKDGERLDDLIRNDLKIIQNPKFFCFSIDAVLLAHFCTVKKGDKILDLGTGSGVIPLLLSLRREINSIIGIEIQEALVEMARRSVLYNGLDQLITILNMDIRNLDLSEEKPFDLITSNPPYRTVNEGKVSPIDEIALAKHEVACDLDDIIRVASLHLKKGGRLAMVHRPYRLVDIINTYRKYGIEPKRLRMVHPFRDKEANLVLIEGVQGGKPFLEVEAPLVVYQQPGEYSQEVLEFYYGSHQ